MPTKIKLRVVHGKLVLVTEVENTCLVDVNICTKACIHTLATTHPTCVDKRVLFQQQCSGRTPRY